MKNKLFVLLGIALAAVALVVALQAGMRGASAAHPAWATSAAAVEIEKSVVDPPYGVAVVSDTVTFEIVITNTFDMGLSPSPLVDEYITECLSFEGATPAPDEIYADQGTLVWTTLDTIQPGMSTTVEVLFHAVAPCEVATNTTYLEGEAMDDATVTLIPEEEAQSDLGDAPDSSNHFGAPMTAYPAGGPPGIGARFPTVFDPATGLPQGPKHYGAGLFGAWLGLSVTHEYEADLLPDADGITNIEPPPDLPDRDKADDALTPPLILPHCVATTFNYTVTVRDPGNYLVNVWFDWIRDGDWDDVPECPDSTWTPEWAVQNQYLSFSAPGVYTVTTPTFLPFNPTPEQEMWMRMTLTRDGDYPPVDPQTEVADGSGPDIGYDHGETEDYYLPGREEGPEFDLGDAPDSSNHAALPMTAFPGVPARYPTVFDPATGLPQGPLHLMPRADAWLGPTVTQEVDADILPDEDGVRNIHPWGNQDSPNHDLADDGLVPGTLNLNHCYTSTFTAELNVVGGATPRRLNVWFDWNRDGDWEDVLECPDGTHVPEWAVQDQLIGVGNGTTHIPATPFLAYEPQRDTWMRMTLSRNRPPVNPQTGLADGAGPGSGYEYGETEDYFVPGYQPEPLFELGDAPDSTNHHAVTMTAYLLGGGPPHTQAHYPTVFDPATGLPQGPRHMDPAWGAWLGYTYTLEHDADLMPDADGVPNIVPPSDSPDWDRADDALHPPLKLPHCVSTTFEYTVTVSAVDVPFYVNAWFDWNRDGDWQDMPECEDGTPTPEWAVQNQLLSFAAPGVYTVTTPAFLPHNAIPRDTMWMRLTLAEMPIVPGEHPPDGRGPRTGYEGGETEDYYLPGWEEDPLVDIFIRDNLSDTGAIPSTYPPGWWLSPDIWVRHANDGIPAHQNPELGATNYVNVEVHHHSGTTATNVVADLYWGNAALGFGWPAGWNYIGSANLGHLSPGATATEVITWNVPGIGGHFCFLVRTSATEDPITNDMVRWDNNIAQRNFNIVDDVPERSCAMVTRDLQTNTVTVDVVNTLAITTAVDVILDSTTFPTATGVISVDVGSLWGNWMGLTNFNTSGTTLVLTAFPARIHGLRLGPQTQHPMTTTVVAPGNLNFSVDFTEEIGGKQVGGVSYYQNIPTCLYLPLTLRKHP